ncbi:hypothetical protein ANAEL_00821 [Anaerolineales bacterium]|nr:hypothetical protein ANAEL_00821 [Anaerolineales bacterium]
MITLEISKPNLVIPAIHSTLLSLYGSVLEGGQYSGCQANLSQNDADTIYVYLGEGTNVNPAQAVLNGHGVLALISDKSVIAANGTDTAVITVNSPLLLSDSVAIYTVWLDGQVYTAPSDVVISGGQAQLSLSTEIPGEYLVEIKRQGAGRYESGYIQIQAQEVN